MVMKFTFFISLSPTIIFLSIFYKYKEIFMFYNEPFFSFKLAFLNKFMASLLLILEIIQEESILLLFKIAIILRSIDIITLQAQITIPLPLL